jgi:hypothetical protein
MCKKLSQDFTQTVERKAATLIKISTITEEALMRRLLTTKPL